MRTDQEYKIELRELRTGSILNYKMPDGTYEPTVIDWQDIKWLEEDPEGFRASHKPIVLTEDLMRTIRRVRQPDFAQLEFSVTPPGERQVANNFWSHEVTDFRRLHLSPEYGAIKRIYDFDQEKYIYVSSGEPKFWYCWICAFGTGSDWYLSIQKTHQLRFFHQLQDLFHALTHQDLIIKTK